MGRFRHFLAEFLVQQESRFCNIQWIEFSSVGVVYPPVAFFEENMIRRTLLAKGDLQKDTRASTARREGPLAGWHVTTQIDRGVDAITRPLLRHFRARCLS